MPTAALALGVFLGWLLAPWLGHGPALALLYGAVAVSVWAGGYRTAAIVAILGYLSFSWLYGGFRGMAGPDPGGLGVYLSVCFLLIGLGQSMRAAWSWARDGNEAERALRESEATLRAFYDSSPVCMGVTEPTPGGDVLHLYDNAATCRFFGVEPGTTTRKLALAELGADPRAVRRWREEYHASEVSGRPVHFQHEHQTPVGPRWLSITVCPIGPGPGGNTRFCYVAEDVTDRQQAEKTLLESEEKFRTLADNMSQLAWMADVNGGIFWYNRRWYEYTGTTLEEMQGWGWTSVHHPDHVDRVVTKFRSCWQTGEIWEDTFPLRGRDGGYRWFLSRALPIRDAEGRILRWFGTNTDVTEQRAAEQALLEADRLKDEFIATLAHELRNPLAPIRNAAQVLKLKGSADPELVWAHSVIERQLRQMARLLDDLLDVNRISRGKAELRRSRVTLASVIESAVETSRPLIDGGGHELTVDLPSEPLHLDADPVRLAQVFSNLLNNAAKYTLQGGRIHVAAERRGAEAAVSIRDSGTGISAEMLPRVFDLFAQAEPAGELSRGGLGIGLSLVKGLVEMHGGHVEARSEGLGKGSELIVRLPLSEGFLHDPEEGIEKDGGPPSQRRLLIVDDLRDSADSMATLLSFKGHVVRTAYDGEEALRIAESFRPEVVLLDLGMPKMNGYEVCRSLREQPWGKGMYLVALTGWGQEGDRRRSQEAGFDHHMVKPVEPAALLRLLSSLPRLRS